MKPFRVQELSQPGLLKRVLGRKLRENAFVEIENLLANALTIEQLAAADIINILSSYEIPREEAMPHLSSLYKQAVAYFAFDGVLSDDERQTLSKLRYVLDLDENGSTEVEASVLRDTYRQELKRALADGVLSPEEKTRLATMSKSFSLPEDTRVAIYKEETFAVVQQAFNEAIADRRLTADEEQRLAKIAENLEITYTHDGSTQQLVERFKLLARIDAGDLPVLTPAILFQRGEVCHVQYSCRLHELRTVTKRINYSGPGGRIRIMKGLSWRYGSVSVKRVTKEELRQLDAGVLYITNKRLLFNGAAKNVNTPFKKIIHFTLYKDGLQIEKETGRDQFYLGEGDLESISAILESALRKAQSAA
jgi:hypothetical protein